MSNVHSINQDNVLGGGQDDQELTDNEFWKRELGQEEEEERSPPAKKKFGLLPVIGGIGVALAVVGFFGWKIISPYFGNDRAASDQEAFAQIAAPKPQPFAPEPPAAPQQVQMAAPPAPMSAPVTPEQVAQTQGGASVVPAPVPQAAQPVPASPPPTDIAPRGIADDRAVATQPKVAEKPAVLPVPAQATAAPVGAGAEEIAQINKRIDGISTALMALKETVEKLQADMKARSQVKPAPMAAADRPAPVPAAKKQSGSGVAPAAVAKKPAEGAKHDMSASDAKPATDLQLQAVLQDRAWFKTKSGETITASVGEEVKGVGVVKQIDADGGRVVFTNGAVYR